MPERPFRWYLEESLARIASDSPAHHRAIGRRLGSRTLEIEVDGERVSVAAEGEAIVVGPAGAGQTPRVAPRAVVRSAHLASGCAAPTGCSVAARTSRAEIVALAQGERSVEEAVLADRLVLHGAAEDLAVCFDALLAYLAAVVRSPELSALMDRLRKDTRCD